MPALLEQTQKTSLTSQAYLGKLRIVKTIAATVGVSSKGQVVIPKKVRDQMRISEGTQLTLTVDGSRIILERPGILDWRTWSGKFVGTNLAESLEDDHRQEIERDEKNS